MLVYQYIYGLNLSRPIRNKIKNYYYLNKWEQLNKVSQFDILKNHYYYYKLVLKDISQSIFTYKISTYDLYKIIDNIEDEEILFWKTCVVDTSKKEGYNKIIGNFD